MITSQGGKRFSLKNIKQGLVSGKRGVKEHNLGGKREA